MDRGSLILVCVSDPDLELRTYSLEEVVDMLGLGAAMKDPVRWLQGQIVSGRVTGRKIGRSYRMTREDIREFLEAAKNPRPAAPVADVQQVVPQRRGLSKRSRRLRGMDY